MSQAQIEEEVLTEEVSGEFERERVPESKLKSWKSFLGMYAGEHAAGTEFVIGPLFLTTGVSAFDKTKYLEPNEEQVIKFRLTPKDYASYSSKEKPGF